MAKLRLDTPPSLCLLWSRVLFYCCQKQIKAICIPECVFKESLGKFYVFLHNPKGKSVLPQRNGNKDSDMTP